MTPESPNPTPPPETPSPVPASSLEYANWSTDRGSGPGRAGNILVIPDGSHCGPLCIKCGLPGQTEFRKTLYSYPRYIWVLYLLSCLCLRPLIVVAIILALVLRKKGVVRFVLCENHMSERRTLLIAFAGFGSGGLIFIGMGLTLLLNSQNYEGVGIFCVVLGFIGVIVGAIAGRFFRPLTPIKIKDGILQLKRADERYLNTLPPATLPGDW